MRFAQVIDSVCVNVVKATEAYALATGLVELEEGFGIGDYFDGTKWSHSNPAYDAAQQEKDLLSMAIDHEYRLTLLELGV